MCFSVGRADVAVGQEGPAAWPHCRREKHASPPSSQTVTQQARMLLCSIQDNRAGGLGTGAQGQHLSARTWLWGGWVLVGPQMKGRSRALAFGTGKEKTTGQPGLSGRQQDQGGHSSPCTKVTGGRRCHARCQVVKILRGHTWTRHLSRRVQQGLSTRLLSPLPACEKPEPPGPRPGEVSERLVNRNATPHCCI